jgi:uncharacterized protein YndB with AHSA1/START domain
MADARTGATLVGPGSVRLERRVAGPVERVWAYLTDPRLRATWLAGGELEPRVGGRVTLHFRHAEITAPDDAPPERYRDTHERGHLASGVVTAWQPPTLLRHTWDDGDEASEVTFELREDAGAVVLTITHRRLDTRRAVVSVASGWDTHVGTLAARLAGDDTPAYWRAFVASEARHAGAFAERAEADGRPAGAATLLALDGGRHRLRYRRRVAAPCEAVWPVLAEPALRDRWYPAELRFEGPVGGWARERFADHPTPLPAGTLTAWEPPRRLAFTIEADPQADDASVRHAQAVSVELEPAAAATELTFTYTFGDRALAASVGVGWHACLDALAAVAEGREPTIDQRALRGVYDAWFADVEAPDAG